MGLARRSKAKEGVHLVPVVPCTPASEGHTLAAVNDLQAGFMVVPAVGVGEVHG